MKKLTRPGLRNKMGCPLLDGGFVMSGVFRQTGFCHSQTRSYVRNQYMDAIMQLFRTPQE
jgi:hypothetical protein